MVEVEVEVVDQVDKKEEVLLFLGIFVRVVVEPVAVVEVVVDVEEPLEQEVAVAALALEFYLSIHLPFSIKI